MNLAPAPSIEELVRLHRAAVESTLRRVLGRSPEVEDLVQEVFTRLVVRLGQPGEIVVGAWLRQVARNLAVDEVRRRRAVPVESIHLDRPAPGAVDDGLLADDLYRDLAGRVERLPARQRSAVAAQLEGRPVAGTDLAERLGVSVDAAESVLARARRRLRADMAAAEAGRGRAGLLSLLGGFVAALGAALRGKRVAMALAAVAAAGSATVAIAPWSPHAGGGPGSAARPALLAPAAGAVPLPAPGAAAPPGEEPAPPPLPAGELPEPEAGAPESAALVPPPAGGPAGLEVPPAPAAPLPSTEADVPGSPDLLPQVPVAVPAGTSTPN